MLLNMETITIEMRLVLVYQLNMYSTVHVDVTVTVLQMVDTCQIDTDT